MGKRHEKNINRALTKADENSVLCHYRTLNRKQQIPSICSDNMTRIAHIRGSMIKRVWMKEKDIVLCSLREGDGKSCDIELKYTDSEIKTLREGGYITDSLLNKEGGLDAKIDFSSL